MLQLVHWAMLESVCACSWTTLCTWSRRGDDVQVEMVMLDPYVRRTLQHNGQACSSRLPLAMLWLLLVLAHALAVHCVM